VLIGAGEQSRGGRDPAGLRKKLRDYHARKLALADLQHVAFARCQLQPLVADFFAVDPDPALPDQTQCFRRARRQPGPFQYLHKRQRFAFRRHRKLRNVLRQDALPKSRFEVRLSAFSRCFSVKASSDFAREGDLDVARIAAGLNLCLPLCDFVQSRE
jgi:hypothetical protein